MRVGDPPSSKKQANRNQVSSKKPERHVASIRTRIPANPKMCTSERALAGLRLHGYYVQLWLQWWRPVVASNPFARKRTITAFGAIKSNFGLLGDTTRHRVLFLLQSAATISEHTDFLFLRPLEAWGVGHWTNTADGAIHKEKNRAKQQFCVCWVNITMVAPIIYKYRKSDRTMKSLPC